MSGPEYQDHDHSAPDFQMVCRRECAIERPDESMDDLIGGKVKRRLIFEDMRMDFGRHASRSDLTTCYPVEPDNRDLCEKAEDCVRRIQAGECAKFLLNAGQYPGRREGLITYAAAQVILSVEKSK
jgi:hypothetical protein